MTTALSSIVASSALAAPATLLGSAWSIVAGVAVVMGLSGFSVRGIHRWVREQRLAALRSDPSIRVRRGRLSYGDVGKGIAVLVEDARRFKPDHIVGINRGGAIVGGCIAKQLDIPLIEHVHVNCEESPELVGTPNALPLAGNIYLVDDACRKGEHMRIAYAYLDALPGVVQVRRACLLRLRMEHVGPERARFTGFDVDACAYWTTNASVVLPWDLALRS